MKKIYRISIAMVMGCLLTTSLALSQDEYKIAPSDFTTGADFSILMDSIEAILVERGAANKDSNLVFVLANGGVYFVTTSITNPGYHLRLVAEDPDGDKPTILRKQNDVGDFPNMLDLMDDATFRNIHINSMSGVPYGTNYDSNKNGIKGTGSRIIFDGCYLERSKRAFIYIVGANCKIYLRNCIIGNIGEVARIGGFGDVIDLRAEIADTIVVQNCTMYNICFHITRPAGHIKYFNFDHNTGVNWYMRTGDAAFTLNTVGEAFITNNITQNPDYFGSSDAWNYTYSDTIAQTSFVSLDTIWSVSQSLEAQLTVRNNNFFYDDEILNFFNTRTVVRKPGELSPNIPAIHQGDIADAFFEEQVAFTKVPPMLVGLLDSIYPTDNVDDANSKPAAFPMDTLIGIQNIDGSYPTSSISYTAADDNYPLGDLNWFPDMKARWEAGDINIGIADTKRKAPGNSFAVYPNPAGATVTMQYSMSESGESQIMIFDLSGRLLKTAEKTFRHAGKYRVELNLNGLESGSYLLVHKTGYGVANATYLIKK